MDWIEPMKPILTEKIKQGDDWTHEIKWDGIRGMFYLEDNELKIYTINGNERTLNYPEFTKFTDVSKTFSLKSAILDGEIICLDEKGKPNFHSSLIRERIKGNAKILQSTKIYPSNYIIFDILYANGKVLTGLSLSERRKILFNNVTNTENIVLNKVFEDGDALFHLMKEQNLEGIVTKKASSLYIGGKKHSSWFKTKMSKKMLTVIAGLHWKDQSPNSLLLGIYKDNCLIYIGKVASGLTQNHIKLLKEYSSKLQQKECPFLAHCNPEFKSQISWLKPVMTCWVSFMELTKDGIMRHPRLIGFAALHPDEANGNLKVE